MKFAHIELNNFRQYYNTVSIDLRTDIDKNIVLIGGRNGYGKTNLLLSIVWCLYGDKMSLIDDNFKKEIQKEKNYPYFMQQSLNWTAKEENKDSFSVSITISEIELPKIDGFNTEIDSIKITRTFNVSTRKEELRIVETASNKEIFKNNEDDKVNLINDYIIPIDAAKFVFFDAEKIAEIANLSAKEEGSFINDALGKILGLDIYETLVDDIEVYINNIKKQGATKNIKEQIIDREKAIEIYNVNIEKLEEDNGEKLKAIDSLKNEVRKYENYIIQHSKKGSSTDDRGSIAIAIEDLQEKEKKLLLKFNELSEIIPLVILTGKLEEVGEHLKKQEKNENIQNSSKENLEKIDEFIDCLFNKEPQPENSSMTFKDKNFYYEKAKNLGEEIFNKNKDYQYLDFEHDLNNAEKNMVSDAINLVNLQSDESFESTVNEYNEVKIKLLELNRKLSRADADLEDELILDYTSRKETATNKIEANNRKIGENNQQISKLNKDIVRLRQQLKSLVEKVKVNEKNREKIKESEKYIDVLKYFLEEQKVKHKSSLEKSILSELKVLMHKLASEDDSNKLIEDVKVSILAMGQGMKVTLLDQNDNEIRKESLSSGEKQIYISCLIKGILNESIQKLPIFIDTPLGRLDEEHRDKITKKYYPSLSEQVVLFSTNSEITLKRYTEISSNISKSYLLSNNGFNTIIEKGYFKTAGND